MLTDHSTLTQFLIEERRSHPGSSGELNALILDVALACKAISKRTASGALTDLIGKAGAVNVQGEQQQKLDVVANARSVRNAIERSRLRQARRLVALKRLIGSRT